jgi:hypothetical protein
MGFAGLRLMIGERNLAPERGPNVWNRTELSPDASNAKRWLSGLGGAAIAVAGGAIAVFGGSIVYRAARPGRRPESVSHVSLDPVPQQASRLEDAVATDSAHSFPASDAPSWTATTGATPDKRA